MPDFLAGVPFWVAYAALFLGAMARGQLVYWAGRVVTEQTLKRTHPTEGRMARLHDWLAAGGAEPGVRALRRWGLVIVPLSYLTVGFQSMVQAGAGILRIELWKYVLVQIPGALAWAAIYTTIGFAAWEVVMSAAAGSPAGIAVIAALVVLAIVGIVVVRRRHSAAATPESGSPATPDDAPVPTPEPGSPALLDDAAESSDPTPAPPAARP